MDGQIDNYTFHDFCLRCQKVMEHKIEFHDKTLLGVCEACGEKRQLTDANQVHYPKADLWVTRFKIGNIQNVVTGRLLDAVKRLEKS
jgi:hypothetical protein